MMANPKLKSSSALLHYTPNANHPIIISKNSTSLLKELSSNQHIYKQPVLCMSTLDVTGGFVMMYAPENDDFGLLKCKSNSRSTGGGWFDCAIQVFLDHDLKVLGLGRGCMELRETYRSTQTPVNFESSSDLSNLSNKARKKHDELVAHLQQLYPGYQIIPWTSEAMQKSYNYRKTKVDSILLSQAIPDIKAEILKYLLPNWPTEPHIVTKLALNEARQHLVYWECLWLSQAGPTSPPRLLPHRDDYWYVNDLTDIIYNFEAAHGKQTF